MDVYDHITPHKIENAIYLLESYRDNFFTDDAYKHLFGIFDSLETAMHALNHLQNYKYHEIEIGQHFLVSCVAKNTLETFRRRLISWEKKEDEVKNQHGVPISGNADGAFTLHDSGLRTHYIEK